MSLQVQSILNEMMRGPMTCYTLFVEYADETTKFFTFSTEEGQLEYSQSLQRNNMTGWIRRIVMGESLINYTEDDEWLYIVH